MTVSVCLTNGFQDTLGEGNYSIRDYRMIERHDVERERRQTGLEGREKNRSRTIIKKKSNYIFTFCDLDLNLSNLYIIV